MTQTELAAIRERAEKATAGPWTLVGPQPERFAGTNLGGIEAPGGWICSYGITQDVDGWGCPPDDADAAFICAARTDVPALLAEIDRLRAVAVAGTVADWRRYDEVRTRLLAEFANEPNPNGVLAGIAALKGCEAAEAQEEVEKLRAEIDRLLKRGRLGGWVDAVVAALNHPQDKCRGCGAEDWPARGHKADCPVAEFLPKPDAKERP